MKRKRKNKDQRKVYQLDSSYVPLTLRFTEQTGDELSFQQEVNQKPEIIVVSQTLINECVCMYTDVLLLVKILTHTPPP